MNNCCFVGRITHTPELKQTGSGVPYVYFTIAVDRAKGAEERTTDFVDCRAWRKTAEFVVRNFAKGESVGIEGEYNIDKYEGRDGTTKVSHYINVRQVSFVGGKKKVQEDEEVAY